METVSVSIQNLCAPCACACSYCLLQSCKQSQGVDYFRGKRLAERFADWGRNSGLSSLPAYCIGFCAEYPELFDNIAYNQSLGFPSVGFLQCNGIKIRNRRETDEWVRKLKAAGISLIDITFFGDEPYHDRFSARQGDYRFMMQLAESATENGLRCAPSLVMTEESRPMLEALHATLTTFIDAHDIHSFLPDYRGRGYLLEDARMTEKGLHSLSTDLKRTLNVSRYKTEKDWLDAGDFPTQTKRSLIISLRTDNIDCLESMPCNDIIAHVEHLDDTFHQTLPDIHALAALYGDRKNTQLYRARDLLWKWQKRYLEENPMNLYNVTDVRFLSAMRS